MDNAVSVKTLADQLTLWMATAGRVTDAQLASKAGIAPEEVRRARKADPGVSIGDWIAIWRVMGVLEDLAEHTVPMAAVAQDLADRALAEAERRGRG